MKTSYKKGFTLIELLVVIAIIGILSSIVLASLNSARKKGRDARRVSDIKQLQLALELSYDANAKYPAGTSMASLATDSYIAAIPLDPLNSAPNVYTYQATDGAATPAACNSGTCLGYVLKAVLETENHIAVQSDIDGTVAGVTCGTQGATEVEFCVKP